MPALLATLAAASMVLILVGPADLVRAQNAPSSVFVVNTADESVRNNGQCSLREAIINANLNLLRFPECESGNTTGGDSIVFSLPASTLTLTLGPLAVTDPGTLTIDGDPSASPAPGGPITISGNDQTTVFPVESGADVTISNLTIDDGQVGDDGLGGGGVYNFTPNGSATVNFSTFSGNSASVQGGAGANDGRALTLNSTLVADSPSGGNGSPSVADGRYNISDDQSCNFTSQTSLNGTDPELDAAGLQDNGGPTQTIALQFASRAAGAVPPGVNGCATTVATGQRGIDRPQLPQGCDIGAFEIFVGPGQGTADCTIQGTSGRVTLSGTPENDTISGAGGGDDALLGNRGRENDGGK